MKAAWGILIVSLVVAVPLAYEVCPLSLQLRATRLSGHAPAPDHRYDTGHATRQRVIRGILKDDERIPSGSVAL